MINLRITLLLLLFSALAFPNSGTSQDGLPDTPEYGVYRIYPSVSITKEKLREAHTIAEVNKYFKSEWIREYISVEILASHSGVMGSALGKNDTLSHEQKDVIDMADLGTDIAVMVRYMPENTLKHNDVKEFNFTFTIDPENDATFSGGQEELRQYLKGNAIDKIPDGSFTGLDFAAVTFTINEKGQVIDAHLFDTSEDEKIDDLLLETICNMPSWMAAEYSDGTHVRQEFVLTVGNMKNCMSNLLNIRQD